MRSERPWEWKITHDVDDDAVVDRCSVSDGERRDAQAPDTHHAMRLKVPSQISSDLDQMSDRVVKNCDVEVKDCQLPSAEALLAAKTRRGRAPRGPLFSRSWPQLANAHPPAHTIKKE